MRYIPVLVCDTAKIGKRRSIPVVANSLGKIAVEFIAPIYVYPGEDELLTLAENALAAITGEREVKVYHSTERGQDSR